ncbi:MAG: ribosome maturation factor RimP [Synergistaceae bacterium]|nr:ribosome maturation factor RimP [Synergistaceae bacterium]
METMFRRITESVENLGYECVHVGMKTESSGIRLQVLIDSLGGINLEDCERVSRAVNRVLDEEDFQPGTEGSYALEVSSPGVERPLFTLAQYGRFCGREARIRLSEPVEGRKSLTGKILSAEEGRVVLYVEDEDRELSVPFDSIKAGNLVFRFEPGTPKKKKATKKQHEEER